MGKLMAKIAKNKNGKHEASQVKLSELPYILPAFPNFRPYLEEQMAVIMRSRACEVKDKSPTRP